MTAWKWSTTAATNATADSTINYQEGQSPGSLNNSARAMMAAIAKYRDDISGNLVTGGTSTAYTLTTNQVLTALTDGFMVRARMSATSGATPTLNVDSLGAKSIASVYGTAIPTGALVSGGVYSFVYDATDDKWIIGDRHGYAITEFSGTLAEAQFPALTGDVATSAGSLTTAIGNNKVTNAMLAQSATKTIKGNLTGSTANQSDNTMSALATALVADSTALSTLVTALAALNVTDGTSIGAYVQTVASTQAGDANAAKNPSTLGYSGTWTQRGSTVSISHPSVTGAFVVSLWQRTA